MHSHLLPGIDDGAQNIEQSIQLVESFAAMGYRKLITTPHVMSDVYRNTTDIIQERLSLLRKHISPELITIEAAAEYYLDEQLISKLQNETLLTFGKKYLLFETNFLTEPFQLRDFIFQAQTKGYQLILAHPERYLYLHGQLAKAEDLLNRGVLFQININSLTGYYSKQAQKTAQQLIDKGWVHFLGSDCHHINHIEVMHRAHATKYFEKALNLPLLNNTLE